MLARDPLHWHHGKELGHEKHTAHALVEGAIAEEGFLVAAGELC